MKRLLIIQPGRFGDIIICLPIAKWYADREYIVEWECPDVFHEIFRNVDYVTPVADPTLRPAYDKVLDLSFGFGGAPEMWWNERKMKYDSFVTAKYELAGVPLEERWKLVWKRDTMSESALFMQTGTYVSYYDLVHYQGSAGVNISHVIKENDHHLLKFQPYEGFNIFDWYSVIEMSEEIHCIDSSLANFIEVVPAFKNKVKYLYDVRESHQWLKSIYKNGWNIVTS